VGAQHEALLIRQMRFVSLRAIDLTALVTGMVVGVVLAASGAGYRALVAQTVVTAGVRTMALWRACRWRPTRGMTTDRDRLSSLASFGWYHTGAKLLRHLSQNADQITVGYLFGARQLGFYDSAYRWSLSVSQQIFTPLQSVAVSGLSRLQHDAQAFRAAARSGLLPVFSAIFPLLALLAFQARPVILILLGPQWEPSIPLFRILCIAAIGNVLAKAVNWLFLAEGRTKQQMRWGFVTLPVFVIAVIIGSRWGTIGVASGFAIANWVLAVPEILYGLRSSHLRLSDYAAPAARALAATAGAAAVLVATVGLPDSLDLVMLILTSAAFLVTYALIWIALPGGRGALRRVLAIARTLPMPRK
jgi:PST family polysaccharide transporter